MARISRERNISYDDVRKKFYVNLDYGVDESGQRRKSVKTFGTIQDARKALAKFEADKTYGTAVAPKKTTVEEWLLYWLNSIVKLNREETTIYAYDNIVKNHLIPGLGSIQIQKLTAKNIQEYYTKKLASESGGKKMSTNTVKKHHALLKTALSFAVKQEVIYRNPADNVEPPKYVQPSKSFYDAQTLAKLFKLCEGTRLEVPIKLAGYLGMRREEICGLKWECIDFENSLIIIKSARTTAGSKIILKGTKTEKSARVLFAPNDLIEVLERTKRDQEAKQKSLGDGYSATGFVFQWENGIPYRPNYLSELFTKFLKDNDMPKIVFHELRHTFASIANANGISMFDIGKALGHSTPSTTGKIYTHLLDTNNKEAIIKIAESIKE